MSEQQNQQRPDVDATEPAEGDYLTPREVDANLQQAMRREAATRDELPPEDQVFDSGNQGSMGPQGAGHARRSSGHS